MANPTTNFGWVMPTNTDLVTDLPADFEVFGQAVDTAFQYLKGGTTGQILSKTSNTDLAFTWITNDVGDITAVTAGTGISGGGTSGAVTVTNSMATAFTTSGDLIQATGSGTFARLATGTSGQYLTTNGTTNSWATPTTGGMTLLSTTTLSGASTTISSINQTYNALYVLVTGMNTTTNAYPEFRPNNSNSISTTVVTQLSASATTTSGPIRVFGGNANLKLGTTDNSCALTIYNYASTTTYKPVVAVSNHQNSSSARVGTGTFGGIDTTSAITSLVLFADGGNFNAGTVLIYGVK